MESFEGRTAVVTGAASGIGRALALAFAAAGMNVVLADVDADALGRAVAEVGSQSEVLGVVTDTMDKEAVEAMAREATERFGPIHVLCNNAGVINAYEMSSGMGVWEVPDADWEWVMGVNFYGVLHGLQTFVPEMLAHGEPGHIVNTASLAALYPVGGTYGVSKHAVLSLTEGLWKGLRARRSALGASVLCPGLIDTDIYLAERNRPDLFKLSERPLEPDMSGPVSRTQAGMAPSEAAKMVLQSIRENRLYILTHPDGDELVRARVEHILARGGPANLSPPG